MCERLTGAPIDRNRSPGSSCRFNGRFGRFRKWIHPVSSPKAAVLQAPKRAAFYRRILNRYVRVETPALLQIYEFSLNVSKGTLDSSELYGQPRWDTSSVRVQVRACWCPAQFCSKSAARSKIKPLVSTSTTADAVCMALSSVSWGESVCFLHRQVLPSSFLGDASLVDTVIPLEHCSKLRT